MSVLALDEASGYVAAAYAVFITLILIYVVIIGLRFARTHRQLEKLPDGVPEDDHG
jgi:hypothetical protein